MTTENCEVSHEEICRRAYELWQARGCPQGDGTEDWDAAVRELASARMANGSGRGLMGWWSRIRQKAAGRDM